MFNQTHLKKEETVALDLGVPFTALGVINLKGLRWSKRTRNELLQLPLR